MSFTREEIEQEFAEAAESGARVSGIAERWSQSWAWRPRVKAMAMAMRTTKTEKVTDVRTPAPRSPPISRKKRATAAFRAIRALRPTYAIAPLTPPALSFCKCCGALCEFREGGGRVVHLGRSTNCSIESKTA